MYIVVQESREGEDIQNDQREEWVQEVEDQVPSAQEVEGDVDDDVHILDRDDDETLASQRSIDGTVCTAPTYRHRCPQVPTPQHTNKAHQMREGARLLSFLLLFCSYSAYSPSKAS